MCWDAARQFPVDTRSPSAARRFCTEELSQLLADRPERQTLLDDVTLIVSELTTNTVNAGASGALVSLEWHRHYLRLAITDDAPGTPAVKAASRDEAHGRGLAITQALSTAWGVASPATLPVGKQVWAELDVAPLLTAACTCSR